MSDVIPFNAISSPSPIAVRGAGTVAAQADRLQLAKYEHLDSSHFFVPFAVESSAPWGSHSWSDFYMFLHIVAIIFP